MAASDLPPAIELPYGTNRRAAVTHWRWIAWGLLCYATIQCIGAVFQLTFIDRNSWGLRPGLAPHVTAALFLNSLFGSNAPWAVAGALATWMAFRYAKGGITTASMGIMLIGLGFLLFIELTVSFLLFRMSPITVIATHVGPISYISDESHSFGVADVIHDSIFAVPFWAFLAGFVIEKLRRERTPQGI